MITGHAIARRGEVFSEFRHLEPSARVDALTREQATARLVAGVEKYHTFLDTCRCSAWWS